MGLGNSYDEEGWRVAELGIWEVELGGWLPLLGTSNTDHPRSKKRDQNRAKPREKVGPNERARPKPKRGTT